MKGRGQGRADFRSGGEFRKERYVLYEALQHALLQGTPIGPQRFYLFFARQARVEVRLLVCSGSKYPVAKVSMLPTASTVSAFKAAASYTAAGVVANCRWMIGVHVLAGGFVLCAVHCAGSKGDDCWGFGLAVACGR